MKIQSLLFLLGLGTLVLSSCEKREDLLEHKNTAPKIWLSYSETMENAEDTLSVHIQHGEKIELYYQLEDNAVLKDSLYFTLVPPKGYEDFQGIACYNGTQNKIIIESKTESTTLLPETIQLKIVIGVKDYYNQPGNSVIYLFIDSNQPPIPVIEYKKKENGDYTISAEKSYDPENKKIRAYEYLIGSQSCQELIFNEAAYEIPNPSRGQACANPGRAGKGGTYIIATPLSQVDHVFQATGIYSINVRVQDELGLWSKWKTEYIEIKTLPQSNATDL